MVMDTDSVPADIVTRHIVGQVINAIAANDWDALAACVDPAMIYWRPGTNDRIDGVTDYVQEWRNFFASSGTLRYRPHTVLVQGDTAMVEASADGVLTDGSEISFSLVSVMRVAHGRLVEEREYLVPTSR